MTDHRRIGLLSDTHGYLDEAVMEQVAWCDEVWHAGDIGSLEVAHVLAGSKPLRAVHGNIDDAAVRACYPEDLRFVCGGVRVLMTHIAGYPSHYTARVQGLLAADPPDILVCGHTHILRVMRNTKVGEGMLYLNPGAVGRAGIHKVRTLLRFTLGGGKVTAMEVVELGAR